MLNSKLRKLAVGSIPKSDSMEADDLINYVSKTLNSSTLPNTNSMMAEERWGFYQTPVLCQYAFDGASIAANTSIDFSRKIIDTRNNGSSTGGSWRFVSPLSTIYNVSLFANTSGANTTGQWVAVVTRPDGTVIRYALWANTSTMISASRDIYLDKGSRLTIINTLARTVVAVETSGYNNPTITISQVAV